MLSARRSLWTIESKPGFRMGVSEAGQQYNWSQKDKQVT